MKKVLIITYYWPPAGGPGVQRWLKFVKYLPDYGIQPIVYIPKNPTYPIIDEALVGEVSEKAVIIRRKIFEPYQLASLFSNKTHLKKMSSGIIPNEKKQTFAEKLALWIRGNVFIPDARICWVKPSVSFLEKYIKENEIDTVITSGPPHSLHLIGMKLKEKLALKWIADFRDPWTTIGYHQALKLSAFSEDKHKKLEHKVLNAADMILVTSKSTKAEFAAKTSKPIAVITNGFDVERKTDTVLDTKFSLAHIGSLLSQRNPVILWLSLAELLREIPGFADHLELKLIGTVSQEIVNAIISYNLRDYTTVIGYVSHATAIEHQRKSQVLLLIEINSPETKSIIPGKLFEYMVSGRPIIAIGPNGSDFAEIISDTNTGVFLNYAEKDKLKSTILDYYHLFLQEKLQSDAVATEQYSRKNLTGKLAELLK
ncbi:MAG TPA: glycosyltransferase family 4 protein [Flavobacterium sp.]|nr:glycosyltransferase family 4 protein [Flavobacterium sp.]